MIRGQIDISPYKIIFSIEDGIYFFSFKYYFLMWDRPVEVNLIG
jgi:hypothetical protein